MKIKAVFFDRDGTLLSGDPDLREELQAKIESWSGKPYQWPEWEDIAALRDRAGFPEGGHKTLDEELAFLPRYWREVLIWAGVTEDLEERAQEVFQTMWLKNLRLFPETVEVLDWFRSHGIRIGAISNTGPSLPLTLEAVGIDGYFECTVASEPTGIRKPNAGIYEAALNALGVKAEESLFVDDQLRCVEGARAVGMTAFQIDRGQQWGDKEEGCIDSLWGLVEFTKQNS